MGKQIYVPRRSAILRRRSKKNDKPIFYAQGEHSHDSDKINKRKLIASVLDQTKELGFEKAPRKIIKELRGIFNF